MKKPKTPGAPIDDAKTVAAKTGETKTDVAKSDVGRHTKPAKSTAAARGAGDLVPAPQTAPAVPEPDPLPIQSVEFDRRMLEALVCPYTGGTLIYDAQAQELISRGAGLAYPIRSGIPIMLPDEARRIER